jgi:hypothetical protein
LSLEQIVVFLSMSLYNFPILEVQFNARHSPSPTIDG